MHVWGEGGWGRERERQRWRASMSELTTSECVVTLSAAYSTDSALLGTALRLAKVWFEQLTKCYFSDVCII